MGVPQRVAGDERHCVLHDLVEFSAAGGSARCTDPLIWPAMQL